MRILITPYMTSVVRFDLFTLPHIGIADASANLVRTGG